MAALSFVSPRDCVVGCYVLFSVSAGVHDVKSFGVCHRQTYTWYIPCNALWRGVHIVEKTICLMCRMCVYMRAHRHRMAHAVGLIFIHIYCLMVIMLRWASSPTLFCLCYFCRPLRTLSHGRSVHVYFCDKMYIIFYKAVPDFSRTICTPHFAGACIQEHILTIILCRLASCCSMKKSSDFSCANYLSAFDTTNEFNRVITTYEKIFILKHEPDLSDRHFDKSVIEQVRSQ